MTYEDLDKFLAERGWRVDCFSPLEISHEESEAVATGVAALLVVTALKEEARADAKLLKKNREFAGKYGG